MRIESLQNIESDKKIDENYRVTILVDTIEEALNLVGVGLPDQGPKQDPPKEVAEPEKSRRGRRKSAPKEEEAKEPEPEEEKTEEVDDVFEDDDSGDLESILEELKSIKSPRDLMEWMVKEIVDEDKIISLCEEWKDDLPALAKHKKNISDFVKRGIEAVKKLAKK